MITFETLAPEDAAITGSVSATLPRAWLIATDVTGPFSFAWLEGLGAQGEGSAVTISGSFGFTMFATDVATTSGVAFMDMPSFESFFSRYEAPPVYLVDAALPTMSQTVTGVQTTYGELDLDLPQLSLLATDVSGSFVFGDLPTYQSVRIGDLPPVNSYMMLIQNNGFMSMTSNGSTPWGVLEAMLDATASLESRIGVSLLAQAFVTDGIVSNAALHTLASANALVTAELNQLWFGELDAAALASASFEVQVRAMAALWANCVATGTATSTAEMQAAIAVSVVALTTIDAKRVYPLLSTATASVDLAAVYAAVGEVLADLVASDSAAPTLAFVTAADASALAAATTSGSAAVTASILETANVYVRARFGATDYQGWVLNATPRGEANHRSMSTYDNFPFNSFAFFKGKSYGADSERGIFVLEGESDNGDPIPAWVRTGLIDFNSRRDKRMESMYVGYTSDKRLVAKIVTTNGGKKVENWYTMRETQVADDSREGRIEIGKGLHSVYWAYELHNEAGADFSIDVVALWPVYLDRRIG